MADIEVPVVDIATAIDWFAGYGFDLDVISPADDPAIALLSGHGLTLRLVRGSTVPAPTIHLAAAREAAIGPGGTRIVPLAPAPAALPPLAPRFWISHGDRDGWRRGRAGMAYRDLIPDRLGGRYVGSHIRIADGGVVPDYVHFHRVELQLIVCVAGWVRVAYESQGEPIVMRPGDCVVQPPEIRHRVLECSPGLEVVELGCPAHHDTCTDRATDLAGATDPTRRWRGQAFCCANLFDHPTAIAEATAGLARARIGRGAAALDHDDDLLLGFVLAGTGAVRGPQIGDHQLARATAFVIPSGCQAQLTSDQVADDLAYRSHPVRSAHQVADDLAYRSHPVRSAHQVADDLADRSHPVRSAHQVADDLVWLELRVARALATLASARG